LVKKVIFSMMLFLLLDCLGLAQNAPQKKPTPPQSPGTSDLVDGLAQRLSRELNVKTVIGEPIKAGAVTIIPILTVDIKFGGAAVAAPAGSNAPQRPMPPAGLFYMTGEARPLGFVAITKKGTRFIDLVKPNGK
jgi:uncharacterized spore protein YtfJ